MKKAKLNCVTMKHEIQERQRKRLEGLSPTEESRVIQAEILKDSTLSRFWKSARRTAVSRGSRPSG